MAAEFVARSLVIRVGRRAIRGVHTNDLELLLAEMENVPSALQPYDHIAALLNSGDHALAAQSAKAALEYAPNDARLWEFLGIASHGMQDFLMAREALETATLLAPLSPAGQVALASCYLVSQCPEVARSMYRHLALHRERVATSLLPLVAAGLSCLGEVDLALEIHRERAFREPQNDEAAFVVAHFMQLLKYPVELTLPVAHRAFLLAPDRMRNRVALALLHHQCGNRFKAYELLAAVDLSQLVAECCFCRLQRLAVLFEAVGDSARRDACLARLSALASHGSRRDSLPPEERR